MVIRAAGRADLAARRAAAARRCLLRAVSGRVVWPDDPAVRLHLAPHRAAALLAVFLPAVGCAGALPGLPGGRAGGLAGGALAAGPIERGRAGGWPESFGRHPAAQPPALAGVWPGEP